MSRGASKRVRSRMETRERVRACRLTLISLRSIPHGACSSESLLGTYNSPRIGRLRGRRSANEKQKQQWQRQRQRKDQPLSESASHVLSSGQRVCLLQFSNERPDEYEHEQ